MDVKDTIFVAGHNGLVGSAIVRALKKQGYENLVLKTRQECDLSDTLQVQRLFQTTQPSYVFLAAAKVGGILANRDYPADFIFQNNQIQNNVIKAAFDHGVNRLLFLGSSCIYPRECPQPIKEDYLLTGPLEATNRPYALAKIAGIETCWAFNRQYGTKYLAVMPTNLYGPNDNFDLNTSHVIPALIRKMHEAKVNNAKQVVVWGTGTPKREFLYSDDLADACLHLMQLPDASFTQLTASDTQAPLVNIGVGADLTIAELAETIKTVVGFKGEIMFDTSKPDGTPRKVLNVDKMKAIGWEAKYSLRNGLDLAYASFKAFHDQRQSICQSSIKEVHDE